MTSTLFLTEELWPLRFIWHHDLRVTHCQSSAMTFVFTQYSFCNSFRQGLLYLKFIADIYNLHRIPGFDYIKSLKKEVKKNIKSYCWGLLFFKTNASNRTDDSRPSQRPKFYTSRIIGKLNSCQKERKICQNFNRCKMTYLNKYTLTVKFSI